MATYHSGELEAQERAGVRAMAEKVGRIIGPTIPAAAAAFLASRPFVVASTVAACGTVHASILAGPSGFAEAVDASTIRVRATSGDRETATRDIAETESLGLLAIDFATRRRMRVNGSASRQDDAIVLTTREVYSNCPQYIHPRGDVSLREAQPASTSQLSTTQRALVSATDTFFIASWHPERGADASHRGGDAGFVSVGRTTVSWLDYPGNNMFNTLGNLLVHDRCSLLFVDFAAGTTLRIDGRASITWGAERRITVAIDNVQER